MMLKIVNPASGRVIAEMNTEPPAALGGRVSAARAAQTRWATRPLQERIDILTRFRDGLEESVETLARTLTREMGKPIGQARGEVRGTLGRVDFFLGCAASVLADRVVHEEQGLREIIRREPLVVIANVSAWNYPYFVGANVFVPALLAGNAVLYKPSEHASMSGLAIASLLWESGVPRDVFVPLIGAGEVGAELVRQAVDGVYFTGSWRTGRRIAEVVGPRMIPMQLELGGKDPAYVCEDVDVAAVAAGIADGAFYNTGQSCCSVERIYVHESIHDAFVEAFLKTVSGFKIGDPMEEDTYIGPLTREGQRAVLQAQVKDALDRGATLLCGGQFADGDGYYYEPTVLIGVTEDMLVMREESFGPIIGIQSVPTDAAALELMNDTDYGLTAAVYTKDGDRARALLDQLDAGSAYWNCCDRVSPKLPWSGRRRSGMGLTLSEEGLTVFTRPKAYHLRG
jgi:acyl-CoA reductase-like NAD-dependent aldehyde dehydrogenase